LYRHVDFRVVVLACSFVSALVASAAVSLPLTLTPGVAVGTSVLYLVPGIPFLNSFSDLLYRHYICSFSRFTDALVLTCCLSIGICAGMFLMHLNMF
ncbi:MAG: threonine/serine exporter family protein, partial [Muribaculaceae bacterium]|nr:threonine/serine exporter family protein [Muribaculaceae bacterium]